MAINAILETSVLKKTDIDRSTPFSEEVCGVRVTLWPRIGYSIQTCSSLGTLGFAFEPQKGVDAFASDRLHAFVREANTLAWTPPDCSVTSESLRGGEYLVIEGLDPALMPKSMADHHFNDCVVQSAIAAAHGLRRWLLSRHVGQPSALIEELCLSASTHHPSTRHPGRLLARQRVKIEALIEENLEVGVDVNDMAAAVDLSTAHFARLFRQTYGVGPHSYLVERRLQRCRELLAQSRQPISEIALACGLADQAHLTRLLKRNVGLTPAALRRLREETE
jgi:AraC family transcriptional regulator